MPRQLNGTSAEMLDDVQSPRVLSGLTRTSAERDGSLHGRIWLCRLCLWCIDNEIVIKDYQYHHDYNQLKSFTNVPHQSVKT